MERDPSAPARRSLKPRRLALVFAVTALAAAWPARAQWPKPPSQLQREHAARYEPSEIRLHDRRAQGEPRVIRLRVYAAEDYRRQTVQWETRFRRLITRINHVVGFWPGVRFEIESIRPWERTSAETDLGELLGELQRLDRGTEVDRVVGLVAAVSIVPTQIDHIGMATHPGRHMVVRSLHDLAEYAAVQSAFDELFPVERERLLALRKAHKEQVVFLHEWAHTLGLIHSKREAHVMNPGYDHTQSIFSNTEAEMVEIGLRAGTDHEAARRELLALVERSPDPDWDPRDRDALLGQLSPRGAGPTAARPLAPSIPEAVQRLLERADAELAAHAEPNAEEALRQAEESLAQSKPVPSGWARISSLWARLLCPSRAVAAAQKADRYGAEAMKAWSIGVRRRYAIPFDAEAQGLASDREGAYARAMQAGLDALAARRLADVARQAELLEHEQPRLPGPAILRCGLAIARRELKRADALCKEAQTRQEDALPTLRLLADLATVTHRSKEAAELRARADELER